MDTGSRLHLPCVSWREKHVYFSDGWNASGEGPDVGQSVASQQLVLPNLKRILCNGSMQKGSVCS